MSSAMKDARWQLAYTMLDKAGLEYDETWEYGEFQSVLDAAQVVLNRTRMNRIDELAREWNDDA